MQDVLEQVVGVAVGDEALDTVEMPGPVGLLDRLRAAGADVRARVRLGEYHGGGPVALDHQRRPMPLLLVTNAVQDVGHYRAGQIHERRRLSAKGKLVDRPGQHRGRGHAADCLAQTDPEPLPLPPRPERLLEGLGQGDRVRGGVERWRVAVAVGEGLRHRALGKPRRLVEHLAHRLAVEVAELAGDQCLLQVEHFEEVELEVAHVALVMAHRSRLSPSRLVTD
jgi:hypothetical protein